MKNKYGILHTTGFMVSVNAEGVKFERRHSGLVGHIATLPMDEAVELARFILANAPLSADAELAMEAG